MKINGRLDAVLLVFTIAKIGAKEPELPLCPTNMPFFPQNLPMHCRMPAGGYPVLPAPLQGQTMAPFPPEYYKSPSPDKVSGPIPFPVPPGVPGFPPGFPGLPPGMVGPGPMPMPMPMPMPLPAPGPAHKLPVIVMPFYSPDTSNKKHQSGHSHRGRNNRYLQMYTRSPYDSDTNRVVDVYPEIPSYNSHSHKRVVKYTRIPYEGAEPDRVVEIHRRSDDTGTSSDTSRDTSSEGEGFWNGRRGFRRSGRRKNRKHKSKRRRYPKKDLLTPILQYVTKDGYVIFEKKITKDEAKDWLSMKKEVQKRDEPEEADIENVNRNHNTSEQVNNDNNEMNEDVEILGGQGKSKEKVEVQPPRAPKRQHPHKMRNHHTKEEKQKGPP